WILIGIAVRAVDLDCIVCCFVGKVTRLPFGERCFARVALARIFQFAGSVDEKAAHLQASFHVSNHLSDELMLADRLSERFTFMTISDTRFQASHDLSDGPCCDREAPVIECRHSNFKAFAFLTEYIFLRYFHIFKEQLPCIPGADTEFAFARFCTQSVSHPLYDKSRYAMMFFGFVGIGKDKKVIGHIT